MRWSIATRDSLPHREYHHLFPDHLLTSEHYGALGRSESYRALNCVVITWNTNRNISASEPVAYLRERIEQGSLGEDEIRARLRSHLVPYEPLSVGGYEAIEEADARSDKVRSDYKAFLDARAESLLEPMAMLCEGRDWPSAV